MNSRIVVLGSINYDTVAKAIRFPKIGETVDGFAIDMFVGGKGSNQAVQTAMLGSETYFIGNIGSDEQGIIVTNALKSKGVNIEYLNVSSNHRTGCSSIFVNTEGDNMLIYAAGANKAITKDIVDSAAKDIAEADVLITQNEINQDIVLYGLNLAKTAGVTTLLNPAPAIPIEDTSFSLIDYITPNETECEFYTGLLRKDMAFDVWKKENANWFLKKGVKNVCITLGEKGSYFYNGKEEVSLDAFKIKPVDTTAAGDAFNGGFAYGIANKWSIVKSMTLGNACGALASLTMGAQNSISSMEKIMNFLEDKNHNFKNI